MRRWHELPKFTQDLYRERDEQRARAWRNAKARERRAEKKRLESASSAGITPDMKKAAS
jgi:hypothetical protein